MRTFRTAHDAPLEAACEAVRRTLELTPYDSQRTAARLLFEGRIVELDTGEGKTLAGALGALLHADTGARVRIATANDYLARRDAEWMRPAYEARGLSVGCVVDGMPPAERRAAHQRDIVYGTLREFGFDYLRSRLTARESGPAGGAAAIVDSALFDSVLIVDEADSLLIDEARTPLIISRGAPAGEGLGSGDEGALRWCAELAPQFREGADFERRPDNREVMLTDAGRRRLLSLQAPDSARALSLDRLHAALERAISVDLHAQRDRDYVVRDGKLLIVDEYTGRTSEGRTWSEGIHQALEAREGLELTPRTRTAASITVQEFATRFRRLAGMTGTALEARHEFRGVYGAPVRRVAPHCPSRRRAERTVIVATLREKWEAVAGEAERLRGLGRPVLIGTRTVEASEALAAVFRARGIPHVVLSARNPDQESEIVAAAGAAGRVTIATNMAGRGTDIRLDDEVRAAGGLHVIGTELHASARIDRQLAGRCARQGEPGSHRWFLSAEDEVLQRAEPDRQPRGAGLPSLGRFRAAQRALERRHVEERLLLRLAGANLAKSYATLGLDPVIDRIE
ncbi:MAG: hypothetical protein KF774_15785 [Planctomyces sp.]|nr:hypothetical protein [Planctomyces sp.]